MRRALLCVPLLALLCSALLLAACADTDSTLSSIRNEAERGKADAQYNLGLLYANGRGGPRDRAEGRKWLLKAATQGDADASFWLGLEYSFHDKDYKAAYAWFDVAASQAGLSLGYTSARNNRDIAGAKLDPASLAEAQKLAKQYHKRYVEPFQ